MNKFQQLTGIQLGWMKMLQYLKRLRLPQGQ